jgi:hypothetical protein
MNSPTNGKTTTCTSSMLRGYAKWVAARGIQVAEDLLDDPGSWLGEDWWQARIPEHGTDPEIDLDPFLGSEESQLYGANGQRKGPRTGEPSGVFAIKARPQVPRAGFLFSGGLDGWRGARAVWDSGARG